MYDSDTVSVLQMVDLTARDEETITMSLPPPAPSTSLAVMDSIMSSEGSDSDSDSDSDDDTSAHDSISDQEPTTFDRNDDEEFIEIDVNVSKAIKFEGDKVKAQNVSPLLTQTSQKAVKVLTQKVDEGSAFGVSYSDVRTQRGKEYQPECISLVDENENKHPLRSLSDDLNNEEFDYGVVHAKPIDLQSENKQKAIQNETHNFDEMETLREKQLIEELRLAVEVDRSSTFVPGNSVLHENERELEMLISEKELSNDRVVTESVVRATDCHGTILERIEENEVEDAGEKETSELPFASHKWTEIELQPANSDTVVAPPEADDKTLTVSYVEARDDLMHDDTIRDGSKVEFEVVSCLLCLHCFRGPKLSFQGGDEEHERLFCLAATPMAKKQYLSSRMLSTIYREITGSESLQRETNWEQIGFQGSDPSTDLRSCGVLSLLQMLYLVTQHPTLTRKLYQLSQHKALHFPLACTMINITRCCLHALRSKKLHSECNRQKSVLSALNLLFASIANSVAETFTKLQKIVPQSQKSWPLALQKTLEQGENSPTRVIGSFLMSEDSAKCRQ